MKRLTTLFTCLLVSIGMCQTDMPHKHRSSQPSGLDPEHGTPGEVRGYVRDIACLLRNPKASAADTQETRTCMKQCIAAGSPIGILSLDGTLYIPISNTIPDVSVRKNLLPYVGKYVRATGETFERGQLHAIAISSIQTVDDSKVR